MVTRRETILGLAAAGTGGAVLSAGAFTSSVSAGADMRVVVVSDLRLEPARDPVDDDDRYVDDDGEIAVEIEKLNQRAFTEFGELVLIRNEGNVSYDRLTFEFIALDESDEESTDVMGIVSDAGVDEENGTFIIEPDGGLEPGGEPVGFGITVDLLPDSASDPSDLPDPGAEFELEIVAERLE